MSADQFLFPRRQTRRDFLQATSVATAGLLLPGIGRAADDQSPGTGPARIGTGKWTYEAVPGWGQLPEGMKYGLGCGVIVDGRDRVYVTSRSTNPCVAIFDRDGKLLETWGEDFAGKIGYSTAAIAATAHCLYWSQEGGKEYIYWTENIDDAKSPKFGARVYKTDLNGKILYQIGNVSAEGSTAQKFDWTNPTDVAVAPNGDIYVVDGYGSQRVTRFDRNFKPIKTIGGKGKENGQFNTCHGVWVNTLKSDPEIYIADRNNNRIEVYSLELDYKRSLTGEVRNPCCFYQHGKQLYVPDLAARVTILEADDRLAAHLGDGKQADGKTGIKDNQTNPALFYQPHALCVDSRGDLYVVEWIPTGRPRKFRHVPA